MKNKCGSIEPNAEAVKPESADDSARGAKGTTGSVPERRAADDLPETGARKTRAAETGKAKRGAKEAAGAAKAAKAAGAAKAKKAKAAKADKAAKAAKPGTAAADGASAAAQAESVKRKPGKTDAKKRETDGASEHVDGRSRTRNDAKSYTKKELANLAGYTYRRLYDIDRELPEDKKLFVYDANDSSRFDLSAFIRHWVEYNVDQTQSNGEKTLDEVRAIHEQVKTRKTELEVARMEGSLVDINDIYRLWATVAATLTNNLMRLPSKVAPMLTMIADSDVIAQMLAGEIRQMLNTVADTPVPDYASSSVQDDAHGMRVVGMVGADGDGADSDETDSDETDSDDEDGDGLTVTIRRRGVQIMDDGE